MRYPARRVSGGLATVIIILAGILFCETFAQAQITTQVFVDPHTVVTGGAVGFAFAGDKFVGSVQNDGKGVLYQTDLQGRSVSLFAPDVSIPTSGFDGEHPVAASPGLGGFPQWDIYVGAGNSILHISHDGSKSNVFASNLPGSVQSIRFDTVGTFKFEMLVATLGGSICHISSRGTLSCPINASDYVIEGMDIAPLGAGFGSFDGQLIAVGEYSGLVHAISPSWQVTVLNPSNPIPWAESLNFVPTNLGASGSTVEGFYEANYPKDILKADAGQFSDFKGDAIIASEHYILTIWRMHWTGTGFDIASVGSTPNQAEDAIFVTPSMLTGTACPAKSDARADNRSDWCEPHCQKMPTKQE